MSDPILRPHDPGTRWDAAWRAKIERRLRALERYDQLTFSSVGGIIPDDDGDGTLSLTLDSIEVPDGTSVGAIPMFDGTSLVMDSTTLTALLEAIQAIQAMLPQVVLLEAGQDASDVPADTPIGAIIFQKDA